MQMVLLLHIVQNKKVAWESVFNRKNLKLQKLRLYKTIAVCPGFYMYHFNQYAAILLFPSIKK